MPGLPRRHRACRHRCPVRRLDGLHLDVGECHTLAPILLAAGHAMADIGHHTEADTLARLSIACAAVADPSPPPPEYVTLTAWATVHGVPTRTARRWATSSRLPARRTPTGWMVPSDVAPPPPVRHQTETARLHPQRRSRTPA